jgi:hypothetical protein
MHASIPTKLSLYDFAKILGINPLHFGQVAVPSRRATSMCDATYFQYPWQDGDRVGRDEIAQAIAEAEELMERALGFRLAPAWEVDEWRATEQPFQHELTRIGLRDIRGFKQLVKANWGWFISGGVRASSLVAAGQVITYSDEDMDGYDETATVTATVDLGTEPCELGAFYPSKDGAPEWEIRPVRVTVVGAVGTFVFRREQAVLPELMEALEPEACDGLTDANFLETVDIYRTYTDPSTQATLVWEPTGGCGCGTGTCPSCTYTVQSACLHLRGNPKSSLAVYTPADWNVDTLQFDASPLSMPRQPDIVRLYYQSGLRDKSKPCSRDMDEQWKRTVAHFAASLLDRPPCDCAATQWEHSYRAVMALATRRDSMTWAVASDVPTTRRTPSAHGVALLTPGGGASTRESVGR